MYIILHKNKKMELKHNLIIFDKAVINSVIFSLIKFIA